MKTRITELFGIEHPIVSSGMSKVAIPELVIAVCEAGGLGILASASLTPDEARASIRRIREKTSRPFGINITMKTPFAADMCRMVLEEKVPVVNMSLGRDARFFAAVHAYGGKVVNTVTTEKHAKAGQAAGADALIVTGHEAAAHGGAVTSLTLIPFLRDAVDLPIIAAGGFADGRGLVAALALGADAIAMGTRFATSLESPLHQNIKHAAVGNSVADTLYSVNFDGLPCRVMDGPEARRQFKRPMTLVKACMKALIVSRWMKVPLSKVLRMIWEEPGEFRMRAHWGAFGIQARRGIEQGDLEHGISPIGQSQGLVQEVLPAAQIIRNVVQQAEEVRARVNASMTAGQGETVVLRPVSHSA
ncbi:nitronate monooxygenase [Pseudomonas sp. Milli4]|uniref:Nitronate monooxygenase n=1 Tax=Pseudomonas schmalbachii TaxID=2816993 RepID=A0ABS3TUN3_9PSED|nr:nitronate monooxygenase [Pseudomonas schmalbachii]